MAVHYTSTCLAHMLLAVLDKLALPVARASPSGVTVENLLISPDPRARCTERVLFP